MLLNVLQITLGLVLITAIILQAKGQGLGGAFGGSGNFHTKRGAERALFITTIVLGIIFVLLSLLNLTINR